MRLPFFLPNELSYCGIAKNPKELLDTLLEHSLEDLILFFVSGCKDETWTASQGGAAMHFLIQWLNQACYFRRIPELLMIEAAKAVQPHFRTLKEHFDYDITFVLGEEEVPSSTLVFCAFSEVFRDLIRIRGSEKKTTKIPLTELSSKRFHQFKEFLYTGRVEFLWKEDPEVILETIQDASRWKIKQLEEFASSVYKRYISRTNVMSLFQIAHKEGLPALQKECCEFLSQQSYGFEVESLEGENLRVALSKYTENAQENLEQIRPLIRELALQENAAESEQILPFLKSLSTLEVFALDNTKKVHPELMESLPDVFELHLERCSWLDDDRIVVILKRCPNLTRLFLKENEQLTYRTWAALSMISNLGTLDISGCSVSDDDLDLIGSGASSLETFSLADCKGISDTGLLQLAKQCIHLKSLNLSGCIGISPIGIISFANQARGLRILNVSRCPCINDTSLPKILSMLSSLSFVNISGCPLSDGSIRLMRQQFSNTQIGG